MPNQCRIPGAIGPIRVPLTAFANAYSQHFKICGPGIVFKTLRVLERSWHRRCKGGEHRSDSKFSNDASLERVIRMSNALSAVMSDTLTRREIQCLELLGRGLSNAKIAMTLGISLPTVAMHLVQARRKLGAATREQALLLAFQQGLIHP